jgi:hypothetical protein
VVAKTTKLPHVERCKTTPSYKNYYLHTKSGIYTKRRLLPSQKRRFNKKHKVVKKLVVLNELISGESRVVCLVA